MADEQIELTIIVKVLYPVDLKSDAYSTVKSMAEALALDIHNANEDPFAFLEGAEDIEVSGRIIPVLGCGDVCEGHGGGE